MCGWEASKLTEISRKTHCRPLFLAMVALALAALVVNILPLAGTQDQISASAPDIQSSQQPQLIEQCQVELREDSSFISLATPQRLSQSSDNSLGTFDCNNFQLNDKAGVPIDLKQRPVPARVITNLKTKSLCSDCTRWAVKFLSSTSWKVIRTSLGQARHMNSLPFYRVEN